MLLHSARDSTPPTGVVTYLFTDVEGSTERWEQQTADMSDRLTQHDRVFERVLADHGGYVFSVAGDSYGAAFSSADAALAAAVEAQRELQAADVLPVRMGLHIGTAEERDGNYFGSDVNRAARVSSAAHGAQLVVSAAVRRAVTSTDATIASTTEAVDTGALDVDFVCLGEFRLKDLSEPEEIWQVTGDGLRSEFPRLRTLDVVRHNLPTQHSSIVGRGDDRDAVHQHLDSGRIVSIVGPGGMGKTRLALDVAADRVARHPDGVWLVDLAPVSSAEGVRDATATTVGSLGLDDDGNADLAALARSDALLLFDNCEHVVDAVADLVGELTGAAGPLAVLTTTQIPLRLAGEHLHRLGPLASTTDGDERAPVLELFAQRAHAVDPEFRLGERGADIETVLAICDRLDGVPLAIEMAAPLVEMLSVAEIARRLEDRFGLLAMPSRTNSRHETLRTAIEWSHDLLSDDGRLLLTRLSAFAGFFTLPAAEALCVGTTIDGKVMAVLTDLVRRSLVMSATDGSGGRSFRLLDSVRAFASDRADHLGVTEELADQLEQWCADWSDELEAWHVPPDRATYEAIRRNLDNLTVAVDRAVARKDAVAAHRMVLGVASSLVFLNLGLGLRWLGHLEALDDELEAELARGAGALADTGESGDSTYWRRRRGLASAQFGQIRGEFLDAAVTVDGIRHSDGRLGLAASNLYANLLGGVLPAEATQLAIKTRDGFLARGDERGTIETEVTLSAIDIFQGHHALTLERAELFDLDDTMHGNFQFLSALLLAGDTDRLLARLDDMGKADRTFVLDHQADLLRAGALAVARRFDEAMDVLRRAVAVVRRHQVPLCLEECVQTAAFIEFHRGEMERATELLATFHASAEIPHRTPLSMGMSVILRRELVVAIGSEAYEAAWERGACSSIATALETITDTTPDQ